MTLFALCGKARLGWANYKRPFVPPSSGNATWRDLKTRSQGAPAIYIPNPQDALHEWEIRQYRHFAQASLFPILPEISRSSTLAQSPPSWNEGGEDTKFGVSSPIREASPDPYVSTDNFIVNRVGTLRQVPLTSTPAQWGDPSSDDSDPDFQ